MVEPATIPPYVGLKLWYKPATIPPYVGLKLWYKPATIPPYVGLKSLDFCFLWEIDIHIDQWRIYGQITFLSKRENRKSRSRAGEQKVEKQSRGTKSREAGQGNKKLERGIGGRKV